MTHRFHLQRTRGPTIAACGVAFASVVVGVESMAQDAGRVTIDAARCLEIESADERLACFESQVGEARAPERNEPAAPVPPAAPQAVTAPGVTPQAAPPAAAPQAAPAPNRTVDVANQPQRDRADAQGEWVGSITALRQRMPSRWVVTLDNGQMWEQQLAESYPLAVGQRVRVYQSRWGEAYRLQADGKNGFIQVVRVR